MGYRHSAHTRHRGAHTRQHATTHHTHAPCRGGGGGQGGARGCVWGGRGVLGHVCGGRVSGRVLRGTRGSTLEKSLIYDFGHYLRHGKTNISLDSKCVYVFLLMRYLFFHVRNHGVFVVVCCIGWCEGLGGEDVMMCWLPIVVMMLLCCYNH